MPTKTLTLVPNWEELYRVNTINPPKYVTATDQWIGFHDEKPEFNEDSQEWEPAPYLAFNLPAGFEVKSPTIMKVPKNKK
jgi:hypothetical protein